jgi:hypothetical protein
MILAPRERRLIRSATAAFRNPHPSPSAGRPRRACREAIAERFQVTVPDGYSERYNLAALVPWVLPPLRAKDAKIAFKMINAGRKP